MKNIITVLGSAAIAATGFFFAEIMAGLQLEVDYAKINLKVGDIA